MATDRKCARNAMLLKLHILTLCLSSHLLAYFSGKIKVIKTKSKVRLEIMKDSWRHNLKMNLLSFIILVYY